MGEYYFDKPEMTAVVNMFSEGYTAFGYLGMLLVAVLFKQILNIIDNLFLYRSYSSSILLVISLIISNNINSSGFFTILLTHGVLVFIMLSLIANFKKE